MKLVLILIIGSLLFCSVDPANGSKKFGIADYVAYGLLFEGIIGLNSYLASLDPDVYGTAGLILFPLGAVNGPSGNNSRAAFWTVLGLAESLALYNILLDEDRMSKEDIFKANVIGWHIIIGTGALTQLIFGGEETEKSVSLNLIPIKNGGRMTLVYNF